MKIGVAGCGRMGLPMLTSLQAAGFDASGLDVRDVRGDVTQDIAAFSQDLHTVFTVVRDADQTDDVLAKLEDAPSLQRIVICSTLSPKYVLGLRARVPGHITLIDAPMSGAQIAAQEARLSFMLGGDDAALDDLQPLLNAMGAHFHRMGGYGAGMQAKVLNNLLAASNTAMTRQVLDWADAMDLDTDRLLALIHTSSGQNWFASGFDQIEFALDGHSDDNTIGILVKDVDAAIDGLPDQTDAALPRAVQSAIKGLTSRR